MSEHCPTDLPKPNKRWFLKTLGILVLLLVAAVLAAPWIASQNNELRDRTINAIVDSPTVTLTSDSASLGWFSPLSMQGVNLESTNKRFEVRVEKAATVLSPLQLWSSIPDLGTFQIDKPRVRLELPLEIKPRKLGTRLEPTFRAVVNDAGMTVRLAGQDEPVMDIDGIDMSFRVESSEEGRVLTLDPCVIFDKRKLTPKLIKTLIHLFDPTIAETPEASGEVSLSLDKVRIPIGIPKEKAVERIEVEGKLVLHNVSTEPKAPLRKALVKLVADLNGKQPSDVVRLAQESEIRFQVRDGRLHHEGLRIGFPDIDPALQVTSRGSVGLDKTLDLFVELPRLDKTVRKEKGPAKCRITGTVTNPKIALEDASLVLRQPGRKEPLIALENMNFNMHLDHTAAGPVLAVDPVVVFKKAKLNLVTANGLVSLIAPDVDVERQVKGEISLELSKIRVPLTIAKDQLVKGVEAEGKLTLHNITTEIKKPMWQAVIKLLADMNGKPPSNVVRLVDGAEIQFQLRDGRLHHDGLRIGFPEIDPDLVVSSRGSIGTDETLDLHLEVPRLRKEKRDMGLVKIHVTGTLHHPKVAVPDAALVVHLTDSDKATLTLDKVNMNMTVETSNDVRMLSLAPMTLFDKKKLTPEVADQLLKLIVPTLSDLSGVQGEISLSFDKFRVPLGVPKIEAIKKVELDGKLHLHQITVSTKTPLIQTMVKLLADMHGKKPSEIVRIVENAEVRFQVRDGRMYHEGLRIGFPDISPDMVATSKGYVGYDTSLDLVLEIPRIQFNKKDLTITKGEAPVQFQVTGTIAKPNVTEIKDKKEKNKPKKGVVMIVPFRMSKQAWLLSTVCMWIFLPLQAQGQDAAVQPGEVKAVVRISKKLIEDVTSRREIVATVPFHQERVLMLQVDGLIDGRGKLSVDLLTDQNRGTFVIHSQGTAETYARGVFGPVVAMGPAWGPFTTETFVDFDGRKFVVGRTNPWCEVHGYLDRIEGRRGGPVGRAVGHLMRPAGQLLVPAAERQATPIANRLLVGYVNELGGKIVERLNRTAPIEASLNRLYPDTKNWYFRLSTDSDFIQAAYGPANIPPVVLPEHTGRPKDTRLELWMRSTTTEAQALVKLTKLPLAKQLVQAYLEATLPELAAVTEERTVTAVGEWLVISIGAPKAKVD